MPLTKIDDRGLTTPIDLLDNEQIRLGTGNDLQIYHNGTNSVIQDAGTGNLSLQTNGTDINFWNSTDSEFISKFIRNGAVELYYDGSKKFETTSTGATVTGTLIADGLTLGSDELINLGSNNNFRFFFEQSSGKTVIQNHYTTLEIRDTSGGGTGVVGAAFVNAAQVELNHNGSKKFETTSEGAKVTGNLGINVASPDSPLEVGGTGPSLATIHHNDGGTNDEARLMLGALSSNPPDQRGAGISAKNKGAGHDLEIQTSSTHSAGPSTKVIVTAGGQLQVPNDSVGLQLGAGQDLQIYHDGTHSYLYNTTGELKNRAAIWKVVNAANSEKMIVATENSSVDLYYDDSKKFETTSYGNHFNGNLRGDDGSFIQLGSSQDLEIYHNSNNNWIDADQTLYARTPEFAVTKRDGTEFCARFIADSGVELYNNGVKKWATGANGVYHDCNGTLHQQAIHFERGQGTGDYSTVFGVTNYPDASGFGDQDDGHWARIQSKGGTVVVINSDGAASSARNNYDHFSVYQKANDSTNGRRLFSVDGNGAAQFGRAGIRIDNAWAGQPSITVQRDNNDGTDNTNDGAYMRVHGIGETHGSWTGGSTGADFSCNFMIDGSTYATSDRRAKTDIVDCPYGLDVVNKLQPRKYQLVNSQLTPQGDDNINLGFIAQEIKEHIPECVNYLGDAENIPNEKGWARAYALDIGEIIPVLVKAIQELSAEVTALKAA